jgi:anion-transporting  ArsA/GET3 family ATPase
MVNHLLEHRVIFVLGKGGVGRSSVSAALTAYASHAGKRTLLMEADFRTPVARGYSVEPGYEPVALAPNLWGMALGGQESLEEYLSLVVPRPILRAIFSSTLYQYFVQAAPAVRELTMMGKVFHEIERRPVNEPSWGVIVFDAPASGQALSMLGMPFAARDSFGDSVVGREAQNIARFFRTPNLCAFVAVTTAEPLAVAETLQLNRELRKLGLGPMAVVLNRVSAANFDNADVGRMVRRGAAASKFTHIEEIAEIARKELRRRTRERRALGILQRRVEGPVLRIEERRGLSGRELAEALAQQFGRIAPAAESNDFTAPSR